MNETPARYEFRVFGPALGLLESALRRHAALDDYGESAERYLLSVHAPELNLKLRHGALELKTLIGSERGLQQWRPVLRIEFPATAAEVYSVLQPFLPVDRLLFDDGVWGADDLLRRFRQDQAGFALAAVFKRRWRFGIDGCGAEFVDLLVNGARLHSVAAESVDPDAVLGLCDALGIAGQENVSYVLALARVLGRAPLPGYAAADGSP